MINYNYNKYSKFLKENYYLNTIDNIKNIYKIYKDIKNEIIKNYYLKIINNILHYNIDKDIINDNELIKNFNNQYKNNELFINKFYGDNYDYENYYNKIKNLNDSGYEYKNFLNSLLQNNEYVITNNYNYIYTNIYYLYYKKILNDNELIQSEFIKNIFNFNNEIYNFYNSNDNKYYFNNDNFNNKLIIHSMCFSKKIIYNKNFDCIYNDKKKYFYIFTNYYLKNNIKYYIKYDIKYDIYYENNLILYVSLNSKDVLIKDNKYIDLNDYNNDFFKELSYYDSVVNEKVNMLKKKHEFLCYVHLYINNILIKNKDEIIKINMNFIINYIDKYELNYKIENNEIYDTKNNVYIPYICKYNYFIFLLHNYIVNDLQENDYNNILHLYYKYYDDFLEKSGNQYHYLQTYFPNNLISINSILHKFNIQRCKITFLNCMYYYTLCNTDIQNYIYDNYDNTQIYKNISENYLNNTISYSYSKLTGNIHHIDIISVQNDFFNNNLDNFINIVIFNLKNDEKKKLNLELLALIEDGKILKNIDYINNNNYLNIFNNFINNINELKNNIINVNFYITYIKLNINIILTKLKCNTQYNIINCNENDFITEIEKKNDDFKILSITNYKQFINKFYEIILYFYCFFETIINNYEIIRKIENILSDDLLKNINMINKQLIFIKSINELNYLNSSIYNKYNIYLNEFFLYKYSNDNYFFQNLKFKINHENEFLLLNDINNINNNTEYIKNKLIFLYNISNEKLIEKKLNNVNENIEKFIKCYNKKLNLYNKNNENELNKISSLIDEKKKNKEKIDDNYNYLYNTYKDKIIYFSKLYEKNIDLQNYYNYMFCINQNEFKLYKNIKNNKNILLKITNNIINKELLYTDYLKKYLDNLLIDILYDNNFNDNNFKTIFSKIKNINNYLYNFFQFILTS